MDRETSPVISLLLFPFLGFLSVYISKRSAGSQEILTGSHQIRDSVDSEVTGIEVSMVPMSQDMAIEKWMQGHSLIRSVGRFFAAGRRDDLLKNKNDGG